MEKCKQIFEKIDELYEKYVGVWVDVCRLESPTADKAAVDACGAYIIALAEELGYTVKVERETVSGDPFSLTLNPEAKGAPVAFSGHIDTVHPKGFFGEEPVTIRDGEIHGPGVTDCKGGVVAALLAMEALLRSGYSDRPIKLIIQTDEEVSSRTSDKRTVAFMAREAKDAVAFLNLEGGMPGYATVGRKGIIRYRLSVHGIARHSSLCFDGASAVTEAAHKIIELERWKDREGITSNVGVISGGTVANTVPEECSFVLDIRYKTREERAFVEREVERIAKKAFVAGTSTSIEKISERVEMERTPEVEALFERVREISLATGLGDLQPEERTGGSDAADMVSRGVVAIDSLGVYGGYIHSIEEYAFLDSLSVTAKRLAAVAVMI